MTKAEFIKMVAQDERDEYGVCTDELAELIAEDYIRKGCTPEIATPCCKGCAVDAAGGRVCPMHDWEKRHPEFVRDELWQKIEDLRQKLSESSS
jgi:hypothetical protein